MAVCAEETPVSLRDTYPLLHCNPLCNQDTAPGALRIFISPLYCILKEDIDPLTGDLLSISKMIFLSHLRRSRIYLYGDQNPA